MFHLAAGMLPGILADYFPSLKYYPCTFIVLPSCIVLSDMSVQHGCLGLASRSSLKLVLRMLKSYVTSHLQI